MIKKSHQDVMNSLKKKLEFIHKLAPPGSKVVYFDIPIHLNIGDLLIFQGTLDFFEKSRYEITGCYSYYDALHTKTLSRVNPETIILLHGGGNFGDIYPKIHNMREEIVKRFPNNRIIQLPQTIHYKSEETKTTSIKVLRKHPDFHILCRDQPSYDIAAEITQKSYLIPDMAHQLWNESLLKSIPKETTSKSWIYQDRDDEERIESKNDCKLTEEYLRFDWKDLLHPSSKILTRSIQAYSKFIENRLYHGQLAAKSWSAISRKHIKKCGATFKSADRIITTRLHGHIFSLLLQKEHIPLNNNYGKLSAYIEQWTKESPLVVRKYEPKD